MSASTLVRGFGLFQLFVLNVSLFAQGATPRKGVYLQQDDFWPRLQPLVRTLGDRAKKPGQERVVATGSVTRKGEASSAIRVIWEFPARIRIEDESGARGGTTVIDNNGPGKAETNASNQGDDNLIEALANDSTENFLLTHLRGDATDCLGDAVRLDDGTNPNYQGPYYLVCEIHDTVRGPRAKREIIKHYYFDSLTGLLAKVRQVQFRGAERVDIQTKIDGWQQVQGVWVPSMIVREENGQQVLAIRFDSLAVGAAAADGLLDRP